MKNNRCVFLDRDGTINIYKGLIYNKDDIELEDKVATAIKMINDSEYMCIIVSNQPGVARNLCSYDQAWEINRKLEELLYEVNGAYIDDIFICPHHPDKGYPEENKEFKIRCDCRKPKIGMINEAISKYNIDLSKSYIIGDTTIDMMTGKNAGLKSILVGTGLGGKDNYYNAKADFTATNLVDAVNIIFSRNK